MSKGLEALERLNTDFVYYENGIDEERNKEDFKLIEKELRALEIIREKGIDWRRFITCNSLEEYNEPIIRFGLLDIKPYAQDEYELLKEVLL